MLGRVPAGLRGLVPGVFPDELQSQTRVRRHVHQQLCRPVGEETLPAKLTAELRVNVDDFHRYLPTDPPVTDRKLTAN